MSSTFGPQDQGSPPYSGIMTTSGDILATYDEASPTRRAPRWRSSLAHAWLLAGGVGLLVLGLVGGVTYGVGALSGGGSQPEGALPGGAFAFAKVDLDPSAGQKLDAFRFLRQFPALEDRLGGDDLRKIVFEQVAEGAGWDRVDFDSEIAPWMGQRVAVAAYPGRAAGDGPAEPEVVVALAVTDVDGARAGLAKLAAAEARDTGETGDPGRLGFVVDGDYALLAESQQVADRAARDAAGSTLDQDADFSADLAEAGDGVLTAWLDTAAMTKSLGAASMGMGMGMGMLGGAPGVIDGVTGRSTYVARFDGPDVFEVTGIVREAGTAGWASRPVRGLGELPTSSVLALGVADGDELVTRTFAAVRDAWASMPQGAGAPSFDEMVTEAERGLGVELPEDAAALLGDNLVGALDGSGSNQVEVGVRVSTPEIARAERVLDAVAKASGDDVPLVRRRVGEELVVASTPEQAERLSGSGSLGERPGFAKALPDLDSAHLAVWVDLQGVVDALFGGWGPSDGPDDNLEPIEGLGMTVTSGDDGPATFRVRLVTS